MRAVIALIIIAVFGLGGILIVSGFLRTASPTTSPSSVQPRSTEEPHKKVPLRIRDITIQVEVADTPELARRGLSGRKSLEENSGMIFVFPELVPQTFWMRGMRFPLDILWIRDSTVIGIERNAQPEPGVSDEKLRLYKSPEAINRVLEVSAGWSEEHHIEVGDTIEF